MGNSGSAPSIQTMDEDIFWTNGNDKQQFESNVDEIRREFSEKRKKIMTEKKREFDELRCEVQRLTEENAELKSNDIYKENVTLKEMLKEKSDELEAATELLQNNRELKISIAEMQEELQNLNTIVVDFEKEREEYKTHVTALKDVISVSKKMLLIRESQLKELREKVESIEESLSGQEMRVLSQDLRLEYERQLQSIRNLKTLYEERQRTDQREKEDLKKLIEDTKKELETLQSRYKEAEERIQELEELNSKNYDSIKALESNLGLTKAESRQFQAELTVINQLFSEILLGFNTSQEFDLDRLTKNLEDNHALLQTIASDELGTESSSALPKVLLGLVNQMQEQAISAETASTSKINSVEEIVELLPKVWRVLIELLSHQKMPENEIGDGPPHPCYKTVETPKGPSVVLSVSQTFIRLKDLILEKKALEKETGHLKQLNTHLENRLQDQEKRLQTVSSELNKTWNVVGKMQKEHQLLHTQEKILRCELAQKRKLLSTLREELEYSREKWQEAREKNSTTEKQWKQLRMEFAARRVLIDDNNSQESGYSDERASSDDDEEEQIKPNEATTSKIVTLEEQLAAKDKRLKRLEGECGELMEQVTNTTEKSAIISMKLDDLHGRAGGQDDES